MWSNFYLWNITMAIAKVLCRGTRVAKWKLVWILLHVSVDAFGLDWGDSSGGSGHVYVDAL